MFWLKQFLPELASQNKVIDDLLVRVKKQAAGSLPVPGGLQKLFGR